MFKFNKSTDDVVTTFINSLDYWQQINLMTTLYLATSNISFHGARSDAVAYKDHDLKYYLLCAINAPKDRSRVVEINMEMHRAKIKEFLKNSSNTNK